MFGKLKEKLKSSLSIFSKKTEEAKKEIFAEFDEGLTQANNYISEIKNQTLVDVKKINNEANRQAESEKRKIIGAAEIKGKNNYLQILEDAITQIFDTVLSKFMKHVSKQRYEKLLIRLIEESVDALNTKKINIATNKHDLAYVKSIIPNINIKKNKFFAEQKHPIHHWTSNGILLPEFL